MEYYKINGTRDNPRTLSYGDLPNNSHPLIRHQEFGVFGLKERDGRQNAATFEVSSGKMFVANSKDELFGQGKEIGDTSEIQDKKLRKHFESMLPHIKNYRDALISRANEVDFHKNEASRKLVIQHLKSIVGDSEKF